MNRFFALTLALLAVCLTVNANVVSTLNYYANKQAHEQTNGAWGRKLDGKLGHGYNVLTGKVGLPIGEIAIDYRHKWGSFAIPPAAQISTSSSHTFYSQYNWWDIRYPRSVKHNTVYAATSHWYFNQGMFGADIGSIKSHYLNSDNVMSVNVLTYEPLNMCARSSKYLKLNRWAAMAVKVLPTNYHSYLEKSAYRTFVKHWGTHYVACSGLGGQIQGIDRWDYIYSHSKGPTESKYRFQRDTQLTTAGAATSLAHLPGVDSSYMKYSSPIHWAYGGNPAYASRRDYHNFIKTINANPTVVRVKAGNLSALITDKHKAANIQHAINDLINESFHNWNRISTCPKCYYGRCKNGQGACSCYGHAYDRICNRCHSGYSGHNCATPHCSRCNHSGGSCIAPNKCRCKRCYGGSACDKYTCGCIGGEGMVNLANNSTIPASQVQIGDVVQVVNDQGEMSFSDVFYVRERDIGEKVGLLKLTTESRSVVITVDHLLYSAAEPNAVFADNVPITAEKVQLGSLIWVNVNGKMVLEPVVDVAVSETRSMMSIQTMEGNIMIDGVAISSYETNETWGWMESLEERLVYKFLPSIAKTQWYKTLSNFFEDNLQIPVVDWIMEKFILDTEEEDFEDQTEESHFAEDDEQFVPSDFLPDFFGEEEVDEEEGEIEPMMPEFGLNSEGDMFMGPQPVHDWEDDHQGLTEEEIERYIN